MCIIYHQPQYHRTLCRQCGLLQENGFFCRGAQIRRIEEGKERKQKGGDEDRETTRTSSASQSPNQFNFLAPACLLSPPLPPCWPDKGSSLHQRPPRISHLFYWKGRALAQSSVHAGKSSFLLFISQVRDDPRLNVMPVCPQYTLYPLQHLPHTSLGCFRRDRRRAGDVRAPHGGASIR